MSTVEAYEKTPSGAHKITFLGGAVAGTFDDEIGALAEKLAGDDEANPVAVVFEKVDGKVFVKAMKEIEAPEELGGPADESEAVAPEAPAEPTLDEAIVKGLEAYSDEALLAEVARRLAA
jgi:hypothetical protein